MITTTPRELEKMNSSDILSLPPETIYISWTKNDPREIRTPNLLIWSQTHYRCAIEPLRHLCSGISVFASVLTTNHTLAQPKLQKKKNDHWWVDSPASLGSMEPRSRRPRPPPPLTKGPFSVNGLHICLPSQTEDHLSAQTEDHLP